MYVITERELKESYGNLSAEYRDRRVTDDIVGWLEPYDFNIIATYRPKKTKVTDVNAEKLFFMGLWNLPSINRLFYSIERDRYGKSNHAHILIDGDVTKQEFAHAIRRNAKHELPYFENIIDKTASIVYVNKHQSKGDLIQGYGIITQADVDKNIDVQTGIAPHPNKEYHDRAEYISRKVYGWQKNTLVR